MISRAPRRLLAVSLAGALLMAAGCDDTVDEDTCQDTVEKICAKWFSCHRVFSEALWPGGQGQCKGDLRSWCSDYKAFSTCNVDNDTLTECDTEVQAAKCSALPPQCQQILTCYSDHKNKK